MKRVAVWVLSLATGVATVSAEPPATAPSTTAPSLTAPTFEYSRQVQRWRDDRVQRLTATDGWLSLIGLEWLAPGDNRVGSATDNAIVLSTGPAHLGTVTLDTDGAVHIVLDADADATVDGQQAVKATLIDDTHTPHHRAPTLVRFGSTSFSVIDRDGRKALRVKDVGADALQHFVGIDYFPIDASWRIEAKWVPFKPAHTLQMGNVLGTLDTVQVPGKAVFEHDGRQFELLPYQEEPGGRLFFVIADHTSGKQTYGAGRFLYADLPKRGLAHPGTVTLDFNEAYNPPCAFTAYATCPLAPPENRLDIAVTAGEKTYRRAH